MDRNVPKSLRIYLHIPNYWISDDPFQNLDGSIYNSAKQLYYTNYISSSRGDFVNTGSILPGVTREDDRSIGNGSRGPITEVLQKKFFDIVNGRSEKYKNWLTIIK